MKKKEKVLEKLCPILVAVAVCICTAIGFGTVSSLRGSVINTPISAAVDPTTYKYQVLEIEPCWDYMYDENSYRDEIAEVFECSASEIYFKYVSTAEFNGMNEDLVASYDVIVMGLNTGTMNKEGGSTIYNDRSLDGYIYLAYGDLVKYDDRMAGMLPADYMCIEDYFSGNVYINGYRLQFNNRINHGTIYVDTTGNEPTTDWKGKWHIYNLLNDDVWTPAMSQYFLAQGEHYIIMNSVEDKYPGNYSGSSIDYYNDPLGNARFTGNDITKKKMNEIIDFVNTGRPIVLADELYTCVSDNAASANSNKSAYPTSNVYSLLTSINGKENVVKFSNLGSDLKGKIHNPVLEIINHTMQYQNSSNEWIDVPPISYNGGVVSDDCIITGVDTFRYSVDFKATIGKKYFVKVIVDKDTDGRFDSVATVDDFNEVYYATIVTADAAEMHRDMDINLPKNYNGMFGWQILVEELDNSLNPIDRVSVEGHTVVKGETKVVKVLQLYSGHAQALNMQSNSEFVSYMNSAAGKIGYSVSVDYMSVGDFENKFVSNPYTKGTSYKTSADYLNSKGYNMLVIGFSDSFNHEDISDDKGALSCVLDYMENGNSVLFSHDTMQFQPSGNMGIAYGSESYNHGWNKTRTLNLKFNAGWNERSGLVMTLGMRDMVGMDRYNVTTMPTYSDQDKAAAGVPQKADGSYLYEIQGFSDFILLWLNRHRNYVTNYRPYEAHTLLPHTSLDATNTSYTYIRTKRIEEVNQGQVTMYPYDVTLDGYVDVDLTHSQYFQLDMEDDDIVVWYTLTSDSDGRGKMYEYMSRDAANNYYIYSKGNITYTGAGHVTCEGGDGTINGAQEVKLFVNTVIRAATAGNFIPTVTSVNGSTTPVAGTYAVFPKPFDTEYLVQFMAYDEDLATKAVVKDSYSETEVRQHIGRFNGGAVYWNDNGTNRLLKRYSRTGSVDNYLLNGEIEDFYIYNPLDRGFSMAEINANSLLKNMYDCYNAYKDRSQVDLYIEATDYYGETGSCTIQVVEQELFNLD